jgi:hypothetical protein
VIRTITIIKNTERLRRAIMSEGTPAVQDAWCELEPHVFFFLNAERAHGIARKNGEDGNWGS